MANAKRDYYEVLGVPKTANKDELKKAYRKLAIQLHPDKNKGDAKAEEQFKELSEAYAILSDDQKRAAYDRFGHEGLQQGGGGGGAGGFGGFSQSYDFSDIFEDVFGSDSPFSSFFGFGQGRGGRSKRGQDLRYKMELTLEEAFQGKKHVLEVKKQERCETCSGTGAKPGTSMRTCQECGGNGQVRQSRGMFSISTTCPRCGGQGRMIESPCNPCDGTGLIHQRKKINVTIPPGIEEGQSIKISGEGEAASGGGPAGDLYIAISIHPHEFYARAEEHLYVEAPVNIAQAVLGGQLDIPTIDQKKLKLKIAAGTAHGSILRIKGEGMPVLNGGGRRGDLHVKVLVTIPVRLSAKEKKLFEDLAKEMVPSGEAPLRRLRGDSKSFFS
jgi:molecular chaperone DnaJ